MTTVTRKKPSSGKNRIGWTLLMYDTPEFNGKDSPSTNSFFFEMGKREFLLKVWDDIDSFFGFPDGCPDEDQEENRKTYRKMWIQLLSKGKYSEHGRKVELLKSIATVKQK